MQKFINTLLLGVVVFGVTCGLVFSAYAADTSVISAPMKWWESVLITLATALGGVILNYLRKGLNALFDMLAEKTKLTFLANVDEVVMDVVTDLYAVEVEHAKKAAADGKLTAEEREKFKTIAKDRLSSWLGPKGLAKLSEIFSGQSDMVLAAKIEKAVTVAKNAGKAARASDPSKPLA